MASLTHLRIYLEKTMQRQRQWNWHSTLCTWRLFVQDSQQMIDRCNQDIRFQTRQGSYLRKTLVICKVVSQIAIFGIRTNLLDGDHNLIITYNSFSSLNLSNGVPRLSFSIISQTSLILILPFQSYCTAYCKIATIFPRKFAWSAGAEPSNGVQSLNWSFDSKRRNNSN